MTQIIARSGSLIIGDWELSRGYEDIFNGRTGYAAGSYLKGRESAGLVDNVLRKLGSERGYPPDRVVTGLPDGNFYFLRGGEELSLKITPKISREEVQNVLDRYTKFLRIIPSEEIDRTIEVRLRALEKGIADKKLVGLIPFISTRPSSAVRGPQDPIVTGLELALGGDYNVQIQY